MNLPIFAAQYKDNPKKVFSNKGMSSDIMYIVRKYEKSQQGLQTVWQKI